VQITPVTRKTANTAIKFETLGKQFLLIPNINNMDRLCIKYSRQDLKAIHAKANASNFNEHRQDTGALVARIPLEILASNKDEEQGQSIPGADMIVDDDFAPQSRPRVHSYGRGELLDIRHASPTENSPLEQRLSTLGLLHQIGGHPDDRQEQEPISEQKVSRRMLGPSRHHNATMKP